MPITDYYKSKTSPATTPTAPTGGITSYYAQQKAKPSPTPTPTPAPVVTKTPAPQVPVSQPNVFSPQAAGLISQVPHPSLLITGLKPLPKEVQAEVKSGVYKPSAEAAVKELATIKPFSLSEAFPQTAQAVKGVFENPLTTLSNPTKIANDVWSSIKDPVIKSYESTIKADALLNPELKKMKPAKYVATKLQAFSDAVNLLFTPINVAFTVANNIPVVANLADLISIPFVAAGEGASKFSDEVIQALPISQESKDTLKPAVAEISSLAAMVALGKIAEPYSKKVNQKINAFGKDNFQKLTKNIETNYNLNREPVTLTSQQVIDIFQTGKLTTAEQKSVFGLINDPNIVREIKKGGSITITPEQFVKLTDKPYWAKIKSVFGIKPSEPQMISQQPTTYTIGGVETKAPVQVPTETRMITDSVGNKINLDNQGNIVSATTPTGQTIEVPAKVETTKPPVVSKVKTPKVKAVTPTETLPKAGDKFGTSTINQVLISKKGVPSFELKRANGKMLWTDLKGLSDPTIVGTEKGFEKPVTAQEKQIQKDIVEARTYDFKYKVGETVIDSKGNKAVISDSYIENGKAKYNTYPPGKKNVAAAKTWSYETDLSPVTKKKEVKVGGVKVVEKQAFFRKIMTPEGTSTFEQIRAKKIKIDPSLDTFGYKEGKNYFIVEGRSGLSIGQGKNLQEALDKAKQLIADKGIGKTQEYIKAAIEKNGESPRYKEGLLVKQKITKQPYQDLHESFRGGKTLPILQDSLAKDGKLMTTDLENTLITDTNLPDGLYGINKVTGEYKLDTEFDPNEFAEIPKIEEKMKLNLPESKVNKVLNTIAPDDSRPVLISVKFTDINGRLKAISTDGYRLTIQDMGSLNGQKFNDVNILGSTLKLLQGTKAEDVGFGISDGKVLLKGKDFELIANEMPGQFPPYDQVMTDSNKVIVFKPNDVLNIISKFGEMKDNQIFSMGFNNDAEGYIYDVAKPDKKYTFKLELKDSDNSGIREGTILMPVRSTEVKVPGEVVLNRKFTDGILKTKSGQVTTEVIFEDGKIKPLKPLMIRDAEDMMLSKPSETPKLITKNNVLASAGAYADLKNLTETTKLNVVQMPELVRLARELMGGVPSVRMPRARKTLGVPNGLFVPALNGKIILNPDIFKTPNQAVKTLAHEIGHLADYLPDHNMARGNMIGRIASLNKFLRSTFSGIDVENKVDDLIVERNDLREQRRNLKDENGVVTDKVLDKQILVELKDVNKQIKKLRSDVQIKDKTVRKELKKLTKMWRPFNPKGDPEYTAYRYSPPELYADAISVLFNDPALLEKKAPVFFKRFFQYLDQKPEFKTAYNDLQDLLLAGDDEILQRRLDDIKKGYNTAEEIQRAKVAETNDYKKGLIQFLDTAVLDSNAAILKKENQLLKEGKIIRPQDRLAYKLDSLRYLDGKLKSFIYRNFYKGLYKVQQIPNWREDIGVIMQLERAIKERGELANPLGIGGEEAKATLAKLEQSHTPEDWKLLNKYVKTFRKGIQKMNDFAEQSGYYSPEIIKQMKANPAYATFQVLEYLDKRVTSRISKQRGTLKEVANPFGATLEKMMVTYNAINYNNAKRDVTSFLKENFAEEIKPAKSVFKGRGREFIEPEDKTLGLITVIEDGKLQGYYVDKDIADIYKVADNKWLKFATTAVKLGTQSPLMRKIQVVYSPAYMVKNFTKDFLRTWRNMPDESVGSAIKSFFRLQKAYLQAIPSVRKEILGKYDKSIDEMMAQGMLGIDYNEFVGSEDPNKTQVDRLLEKVGVMTPEEKKAKFGGNIVRNISTLDQKISEAGRFIELLPKVASYKMLHREMQVDELGNYIRNYLGSPNFRKQGSFTPVTNSLFMYSNAQKEGISSDYTMATKPGTRSGWWFKMLVGTLIPTLLTYAAKQGWLGDDKEKEMAGVSEYDKTHYDIMTFGLTPDGKTNYLRLPTDETGMFIKQIFWNVLNTMPGKDRVELEATFKKLYEVMDNQLPALSPVPNVLNKWRQLFTGINPYDDYRGRTILTDDQFNAGLKESIGPMIKWTSDELGLGVVMPGFKPDTTSGELEKFLSLPGISGILGKFLKVSDYGLTETKKQKEAQSEKVKAQERIDTKKQIKSDVEIYLKSENKNLTSQQNAASKSAIGIIGKDPKSFTKDDIEKYKELVKKFNVGVVAGSYSSTVDDIIYAKDNQSKAESLKVIYDRKSKQEFDSILKELMINKIVTPDTYAKFQMLLKKKSEGFSLVKQAYAAEDGGKMTVAQYNRLGEINDRISEINFIINKQKGSKLISPIPVESLQAEVKNLMTEGNILLGRIKIQGPMLSEAKPIETKPRLINAQKAISSNQNVVDIISQAAKEFGIPRGLALDIAYAESKLDPTSQAKDHGFDGKHYNSKGKLLPYSSAAGLFMFTDDTWTDAKKAGIISQNASKLDPVANSRAAMWYIKNKKLSKWDASKNDGVRWGQNYTQDELKTYY